MSETGVATRVSAVKQEREMFLSCILERLGW